MTCLRLQPRYHYPQHLPNLPRQPPPHRHQGKTVCLMPRVSKSAPWHAPGVVRPDVPD